MIGFPSAEGLLAGRPDRVFVLDHGYFRVTVSEPPREMGIPGYLIGTQAGEWLLVDGGFPAKYLVDPDGASAEDGLHSFGEIVSIGPHNAPGPQMALCGVRLGDLTALLLTHTHVDHLGGLPLRPDLPVVIGAEERAMPRPDPEFQPPDQLMTWPDRDWRTVAGDVRIGPGLTALSAPGHAPGQLALLIEPAKGAPLLLTSDAASRPAEVAEAFATTPLARRGQAVASARRILAVARARGAEVIWGHCARQWADLPKAPYPLRGARVKESPAWAV